MGMSEVCKELNKKKRMKMKTHHIMSCLDQNICDISKELTVRMVIDRIVDENFVRINIVNT